MAGDSSNGCECARRPTDAAAAAARCQSSIAIGEEDGGEFVFVFSFKRRRTSSWREIVTNSGLSLLDRSVVVLFFGLIVGQGATCRRHTRYRSRSSPFSSPE